MPFIRCLYLCGADSQSLDRGMQQGFGNSEEVSLWDTYSVALLVLSCPPGLVLTASAFPSRPWAGGSPGQLVKGDEPTHPPAGGARVRAGSRAPPAREPSTPTTTLVPRCPRAPYPPAGRL